MHLKGLDSKAGWVALNMVLGVGKTLFHRLIQSLGSPENVFRAGKQRLMQVEGIGAKTADQILQFNVERNLEREYRLMEKEQVRVLTLHCEEYPSLLRSIYDPPPVLYVKGKDLTGFPVRLAVVGTRLASSYGKVVAERLCGELSSRGVCLVSGMARGIDTLAHKAALQAGGGTLAVMGCGLEHTYPPENRKLKEQIQEQGALISEFPMSTRPDRNNFPARNRVLSGVSYGTVVVEAGEKSGALITAHFALEQGREVYAVPGPIYSPKSRGTHGLIQKGAKLVDSVDAVLEEFSPEILAQLQTGEPTENENFNLTQSEKHLLSLLMHEQKHVDEMIEVSHLPAPEVLATLIRLELKDLVTQADGLWYVNNPN